MPPIPKTGATPSGGSLGGAGAAARASRHARTLAHALDRPVTPGNRVEVLIDGPATYEAMFAAIDAARDHINIESYIVEADGPGDELARRLIAKRRQGVKVNLLYDGFGSVRTSAQYFEQLRRAGVELCEYNPLSPLKNTLSRALHLRDHRKLLIVDGRVAFTGGINISSVYSAPSSATAGRRASEESEWRDTHVRVEGPVVATLQRLFLDHWCGQTHGAAQRARYFPQLRAVGEHHVGVAACDAGRRRNPFYRALLRAIATAEQRIWVTVAYFVPTRRLLRALCAAARRGVDVRLVLPGISDSWAAMHAGRAHYGRLLRAGVRIYERHDALLHAKTTVIDGVWSTVGSSNLDWRSFLHNAEANVVVLDAGFADALEKVFQRDLQCSTEVQLSDWRGRGWKAKSLEWLAARFEFLL
ncbi:cardiolipin synthetase [Caldimonas brevitalea]|uniref:Cardiolipin synthetase n=2 Tax=Caldimonas brevitalea TaxID=413882 RepID=A0A0G3BMF0_9BURK|nr:cardiolipin synthetase [Caldimonas brevitalea]